MARPTYEVVPKPRQRDPFANPDEWAIKKGNTTVEKFNLKRQAEQRAKELARNNSATLAVYDAAKKSSDVFDYRSDEEKQQATQRAVNRSNRNTGLGGGLF